MMNLLSIISKPTTRIVRGNQISCLLSKKNSLPIPSTGLFFILFNSNNIIHTLIDYDDFILLFPCINNSEGAVQSKEAAAVSAPEKLNPDRNDPAAPENNCSAGVAFENGLNGKEEETCQQAKIIIVNENIKENENSNLSNEKETAADSNGTQRRFSLYFMHYLLIAALLHVFVRIFQLVFI